MNWKIRNAKNTDIAFIYSNWLNSYHYDSWTRTVKKSIFFDNYKKVIDAILLNATVDIACSPANEDTIWGFIVYEPKIIHYTFVMESFRKFGIFTDLYSTHFNKDEEITITHQTRSIGPIIQANKNLVFNPFKLYERE